MGAPEMYSNLYVEHTTGDPAYDKAFAALADCPSFAQVEQALMTYAHELAERIREPLTHEESMLIQSHVSLDEVLARRIDPAKEGDRG